MMDGGVMAQIRASTVRQEIDEVYAALPYAASFHCLVEEWQDCEELKPKLEAIAASKHRCMRYGRSRNKL